MRRKLEFANIIHFKKRVKYSYEKVCRYFFHTVEKIKILWPTDFSENAAKALPVVTSLAEKYAAEIHILYVLKDYPAVGASYGHNDPEDIEKMKQWEKQTAEGRLDEICEKFLNACPLYFRHISVGEPAKEILK